MEEQIELKVYAGITKIGSPLPGNKLMQEERHHTPLTGLES